MVIPCTQPVIYLQVTEIVKEEEKLTILAKQFMEILDVKLESDGPLSGGEQEDIPK